MPTVTAVWWTMFGSWRRFSAAPVSLKIGFAYLSMKEPLITNQHGLVDFPMRSHSFSEIPRRSQARMVSVLTAIPVVWSWDLIVCVIR